MGTKEQEVAALIKEGFVLHIDPDYLLEAYGEVRSWTADAQRRVGPHYALCIGVETEATFWVLLSSRSAPYNREVPNAAKVGPWSENLVTSYIGEDEVWVVTRPMIIEAHIAANRFIRPGFRYSSLRVEAFQPWPRLPRSYPCNFTRIKEDTRASTGPCSSPSRGTPTTTALSAAFSKAKILLTKPTDPSTPEQAMAAVAHASNMKEIRALLKEHQWVQERKTTENREVWKFPGSTQRLSIPLYHAKDTWVYNDILRQIEKIERGVAPAVVAPPTASTVVVTHTPGPKGSASFFADGPEVEPGERPGRAAEVREHRQKLEVQHASGPEAWTGEPWYEWMRKVRVHRGDSQGALGGLIVETSTGNDDADAYIIRKLEQGHRLPSQKELDAWLVVYGFDQVPAGLTIPLATEQQVLTRAQIAVGHVVGRQARVAEHDGVATSDRLLGMIIEGCDRGTPIARTTAMDLFSYRSQPGTGLWGAIKGLQSRGLLAQNTSAVLGEQVPTEAGRLYYERSAVANPVVATPAEPRDLTPIDPDRIPEPTIATLPPATPSQEPTMKQHQQQQPRPAFVPPPVQVPASAPAVAAPSTPEVAPNPGRAKLLATVRAIMSSPRITDTEAEGLAKLLGDGFKAIILSDPALDFLKG